MVGGNVEHNIFESDNHVDTKPKPKWNSTTNTSNSKTSFCTLPN